MRDARKVPIYRALHRPNLFLGGERKLVQSLMAFCGTVVVSNPASPMTWIVVGVVYSGCMAGIRKLGKKDARFAEVYRRQLKYQRYYPPKRGLDAPRPQRTLG